MFAILLLQVSVGDLIAGIPRDAGAIVVYFVLALFIGFTWVGSRPGASRKDTRHDPDRQTSTGARRPKA